MEEFVSISKFMATSAALLDKMKKTGETILLTRRGELIARVIPLPATNKSSDWLGSFKSSGKIVGDIISPGSEEKNCQALQL